MVRFHALEQRNFTFSAQFSLLKHKPLCQKVSSFFSTELTVSSWADILLTLVAGRCEATGLPTSITIHFKHRSFHLHKVRETYHITVILWFERKCQLDVCLKTKSLQNNSALQSFFCGVLFTTIRCPLSTQSFFWEPLLLGTLHERWGGPCIFSFEFGCSFPWFPEVGISRNCWSIARKWSSRVIVLGELTFLSWLQTSAMAPPFSWSRQMWLPSDVLQSICKCLKIMAGQTCVKEAIFTLARYKSSPSSALHLPSCRFYFFVHQQQKIW